MIVLKIVSLLLWLLIIPFCIGLLPVRLLREEDRTCGSVFVSGYIVMLALFELIGIPIAVTVVYHSFSRLSWIFAAAAFLLAAAGVILTLTGRKKGYVLKLPSGDHLKKYSVEEKLYFILFLFLVGLQMYMVFTRASFDGDDAYYGVQGLIAQQKDTLYRINPYTGRSAPLDVRHVMALIPVWEAFVGKMSGIHVAIIAHSVVPLTLLPLTYLIYFQIGRKLFGKKEERKPLFMIIIALFQLFGNVSIYTNETFLLTRTWQGKSLAGNFMIPAVFWLFLCLFEGDRDKEKRPSSFGGSESGYWLMLGVLNLAAGISSSLAVLLCSLLTVGLAFLFTLKERKFSVLLKAGATCIPGALYVLTYLIISH